MKKIESNLLSLGLLLSALLSVPFLYRIYDEDFKDSEWRTYQRILVPFLGVSASCLQFFYMQTGKPWLKISTKVVLALTLLGSIYYTAFGMYYASSHVCDEIEDLCLSKSTCLSSSIFEVYDTILFISCFFGLTIFCTIGLADGTTVTVAESQKSSSRRKAAPRKKTGGRRDLDNSRTDLIANRSPVRRPTNSLGGANRGSPARGGRGRGRGRGSL